MDLSREAPKPDERGLGDASAESQGKLALALGVIAIALSLVLGFVYLISVRRLEREVAQLSQQTEGLSRWSCAHRSNRRRWLSRLRKRL